MADRIKANWQRVTTAMNRGQITLVALLLGVLGLTVGLSVVSRALTDLKQASYVDFGTKALAAAEAGAEYGLYQVSRSPGFNNCAKNGGWGDELVQGPPPILLSLQSLKIKSVYYAVCPDVGTYAYKPNVAKDDVFQVNLTNNGTSQICSSIAPVSASCYSLFWTNGTKNDVSMEVSVLDKDSGTGTYYVRRYAFNDYLNAAAGNNFTNSAQAGLGLCGVFQGTATCPSHPNPGNWTSCLFGGNSSSTPRVQIIPSVNPSNANAKAIQIRVKPLSLTSGFTSDIQVCQQGGGLGIPGQFVTITSRAVTANGTTRVISVRKDLNGFLPSVFDNVIFSGGSLTK